MMSSLNSAATNALLLEQDVLSTSGRINSIWELYTKNVNFQNSNNDILKVILKSLEKNVINHLSLSDEELESCISQFRKMVQEICKDTDQNVLTVFLLVLSDVLSDYISIKGESSDNIEINMSESDADVSKIDELKIMSTMERYGLLDSYELRSLLDNGNHDLTTACKNVIRRWENNSPLEKGCDVDKNPPLTLDDFVPNWREARLRALSLIVMINDCFPQSSVDMMKIIAPTDDIDPKRFYCQGSYLTNLANLKVLSATAHYINELFDMDTITAVYTLSSVNDKLRKTINQVGNAASLIFSQMVVLSMLMRYLILEKGENAPITITTIEKIRNQLSRLADILDNNNSPVFNINGTDLLRDGNPVDEYVNFVYNSDSLAVPVRNGKDQLSDGYRLSDDSLDVALNELLSGLDEICSEVETLCQSVSDVDVASLGIGEALSSPAKEWGREQANTDITRENMPLSIVQCGKTIHEELNHSLLDGNLESAANSVAREMILEALITKEMLCTDSHGAELRSIKECIERDVATYKELLESVPGGISKYESSARSFINDMLEMGISTQT